MRQNHQQRSETEEMTDSLGMLLVDALKGIVYESHEEHVDYEETKHHQQSGSSGGGGSTTSLLLAGVAFAAVGYALGKRSRSSGASGDTPIDIQGATDKAADRIREGGEELAERTEATAGQASERIEETSEGLGEEVEERGSQASDEIDGSD